MPVYALYIKETCPYCAKVLRFIEQKGVELPQKSVFDPETRAELVGIGGKPQVPCLVIDGQALYESDDIIAYLDERFPTK